MHHYKQWNLADGYVAIRTKRGDIFSVLLCFMENETTVLENQSKESGNMASEASLVLYK